MNKWIEKLKGKKLMFGLISIGALVVCWFATAKWQALSPSLGIVKDGIRDITLGFFAAHTGAEIGHKYVEGKPNT